MSGLLRRLTRRRPATADETGTTVPASSEPAGAPADTPAEPGGGHPVPLGWATASPTGDQPATARSDEAAAGDADSPKPSAADATPGEVVAAGGAAVGPARDDASSTPGAEDGGDEQATQVLPATSEQSTVVEPTPAAPIAEPPPARDLPAGIDPSELAGAPAPSARRGKLRRRLRYLQAVRDLLLRDLGGFAYEVQRTAGGTATDIHRRLIEAKINRIATLDTEVRGIEGRLGEPHGEAVLREPGIGGTCPECGELHASDAHYCARCGAPLDAKARARRDAAVAAALQQTTGSHATAEPTAASVLWAAGPRPGRAPHVEPDEEPHPSPVTSEWLAISHHGAKDEAEAGPAGPSADERPETGESESETRDISGDREPTAAGETAPATDDEAVAAKPKRAGAEKPAAETPASETAAGRAGETIGTRAGEATATPAGETAETSAGGATEMPAGETIETPAAETTEAPAGETTETPAGEGAESPAGGATEMPAGETAEPPADEAAETPAGGATETPPGDATDAAAGDEAAADVPAKPKRARARKPAADAPEFEPGPNGKRDEDVAAPVEPGDPLTSQREQGS